MTKENPALRLYSRLREWRVTPQGKAPMEARAPDGDWADRHLEALKWIVEVGDRMRQLDQLPDGDPDESKAFVEALLMAVFTKDGFAVASQRREHLSKPELNALRLLGLQWPSEPDLAPDSIAELTNAAGAVRDLVNDSPSLAPEVRNYLLDLADHLESAIAAVDTYGSADVARLANELIGALAAHFGDAAANERTKAGDIVKRVLIALRRGAGLAVLAAIEGATSGVAQGMITPG